MHYKDIKNAKIVFSGGGTAGHVFPILAVAASLKNRFGISRLLYLGTATGIERKIVGAKMPYQWILAGKLRRYFSLITLWDFIKLGFGILVAIVRIGRFKPDLIFIKGGFVSLPALFAAKILRVKIVNHESDAALGIANKIAHRWADKTCFGFELNQYAGIDVKKSIYTGTPSQPNFLRQLKRNYQRFGLIKKLPVVLIIGGSQGARAINSALHKILPALLKKAQIIHVAGRLDFDGLVQTKQALPQKIRSRYCVKNFLSANALPVAYAVADLVVSRAGASSLADISLAKKPAIVVPLPWAAGSHQEKNAKIFSRQDAIEKLDQKSLTPRALLDTINALLSDEAERKLMSKRIARLAQPQAADKIAEVIVGELNN